MSNTRSGGGNKSKPRKDPNSSNKGKNWNALNMRRPGGATLAEVQDMARHGQLTRPEVRYRGYGYFITFWS